MSINLLRKLFDEREAHLATRRRVLVLERRIMDNAYWYAEEHYGKRHPKKMRRHLKREWKSLREELMHR